MVIIGSELNVTQILNIINVSDIVCYQVTASELEFHAMLLIFSSFLVGSVIT